jgi:predicted CopG family antitoxin
MKKLIKRLFKKKKKGLLDVKVNFIIDDSLERVKPGPRALKKLEEANFHLSKMKSFPK